MARAVVNEFAKMRHLGAAPVLTLLVLGVSGLTVLTSASVPMEPSWDLLLGGMSGAVPMLSPLLLAVLASRQVDIEHQGQGWLLSRVSGLSAGALCRAKLVALGALVVAATVVQSALVVAAGTPLLGVPAPVPWARWLGYTAGVAVINLVVLAVHMMLAAVLDNQLVGLGLGLLGTLVAVFADGLPRWSAYLSPWGYYSLMVAADYQGTSLVALTPSYGSVAALAAVGAALFLFATRQLDRQEV